MAIKKQFWNQHPQHQTRVGVQSTRKETGLGLLWAARQKKEL